MAQAKKLSVTPASQWQASTQLMELPSGRVVEIKRVNASTIIMEDGSIPDDLYPYMVKAISGAMTQAEAEQSPQAIKAGLLIANRVTQAAIVNPVVADVADYEAGIICINDIDDIDRQFISMWAMGGGDEKTLLKRFRQQVAKRRTAASNGKGL